MGDVTYQRGDMDILEHKSTYGLFMELTKWGSLHVAALVLLLVLWFCTDLSFIPAVIAAGVLEVVGWTVLKKKPAAH